MVKYKRVKWTYSVYGFYGEDENGKVHWLGGIKTRHLRRKAKDLALRNPGQWVKVG